MVDGVTGDDETTVRKMRIAEVARRASVSTATVSRVLNGNSQVGEPYRKRVLDAISELDYRPNRVARSLRKQRSAMIVDRVVSDPRADAVLPDNVNGVRIATQLLLDSGYRDIGILGGPLSTETAAERPHTARPGVARRSPHVTATA